MGLEGHYGFVIYRFCSKLVYLSKPVEVTNNGTKNLAYHRSYVIVQAPGAMFTMLDFLHNL
jgi:hypothetical protein